MSDELPQGWSVASLEDIGRVYCGQSPPKTEVNGLGDGTPYVTGPEQWDGRSVHENKWTTSPRRIVPAGCIFITVKGAGVGTLFPGPPCAIGRDIYAFLPTKPIPLEFARFVLQHTIHEIVRQASGLIPGLSRNHLVGHEIPLPPLGEQQRIVAKLKALLGKVDACQQRLAKIPVLLKRFRQSVLAAACSGRLTVDWREENPTEEASHLLHELTESRERFWESRELAKMKATGNQPKGDAWKRKYKQPFIAPDDTARQYPNSWKSATVSQLALLDVGLAFKSSEFKGSGVRLLRGENLEPGRLRWNDTKYWPMEKLVGLEHLLIEEGDIILALDRPVISSGLKIARAAKADLPSLLVQRMMRFKMVDPKLTPWVYFNLSIPAFIRHLSAGLTGSDLPHVTGTGVAEYAFGLPPLAEQSEIVRRAEVLFALAEALEARYAKAKAHVDKLTPALLAKAFRGALVPQDPNDEPASALLVRVRRRPE